MKKEQGIHPDLDVLNQFHLKHKSIGAAHSEVPLVPALVFSGPKTTVRDLYEQVAIRVRQGHGLVIILSNTREGVKKTKTVAKRLVEVGLTSTEFNRDQLTQAGYQQFIGGFSFRYVHIPLVK